MSHFVGKVTQKALIYKDGKILLNRDVDDDVFDLPGGRIDFGEQPEDGLRREMKEELGIEVQIGKPVYTCQTLWGKEKSPHFFIAYEGHILSPLDQMKVDGLEVAEMRWVLPSEISNLKLYDECIQSIQKFLSSDSLKK